RNSLAPDDRPPSSVASRAGRLKGSRACRYDRPMAVTDDRPVADQLAELGAQLAWVRDYLCPRWAEAPTHGPRGADGRSGLLGRPGGSGPCVHGARAGDAGARALRSAPQGG